MVSSCSPNPNNIGKISQPDRCPAPDAGAPGGAHRAARRGYNPQILFIFGLPPSQTGTLHADAAVRKGDLACASSILVRRARVGRSVADESGSEANEHHSSLIRTPAGRDKCRTASNLSTTSIASANAVRTSEILERAGARDADLILAVTQSDETNLVAANSPRRCFNIPTRSRASAAADYSRIRRMFSPENFAVDTVICPEQVLT